MNKSAWPLTRSIFAIIIGSVVAVACMFASIYVRKSFGAQSLLEPVPFVKEYLRFALGIGSVTFLSLLLIGLPVQAVMQKERAVGYIWHVLPAVFFGTALFTGVMGLLNAFESAIEVNDIIRGAGLGFISSTVAWFIRRPDLDSYDRVLKTINNTLNPKSRRRARAGLAQSRAMFTR